MRCSESTDLILTRIFTIAYPFIALLGQAASRVVEHVAAMKQPESFLPATFNIGLNEGGKDDLHQQ